MLENVYLELVPDLSMNFPFRARANGKYLSSWFPEHKWSLSTYFSKCSIHDTEEIAEGKKARAGTVRAKDMSMTI